MSERAPLVRVCVADTFGAECPPHDVPCEECYWERAVPVRLMRTLPTKFRTRRRVNSRT